MDAISMNSEHSKTSDPCRLLLNLTDKMNLKWGDTYVALSNLNIYYTWKNKKGYTNFNLHPAPSTSTQLISASTQLSYQHPQHHLNQNIARNWAISSNLGRKIKSCPIWLVHMVFWHTWYFGGVHSESRLRFLKFRPQNLFLGKFGPKNSKFSILSENWYSWYLKDGDSYSNISFLNFKS